MKSNKGIKYFGIILAIFLILVIVSFSIFVISTVFSFVNKDAEIGELDTIKLDDNIKNLDIDLSTSKLIIEKGEENTLETNNSNLKSEVIDGTLHIKDKKQYFRKNLDLEVILTIKDEVYDKVDINNGAGKFFIESLKTNDLNLEVGAGTGQFYNLEVYNNTKIESGVGGIEILDGELNNLDLKSGIGKFYLVSVIKGKSKINSGIGEFFLNLKDSKDDYKINIDKGIGSIRVDGNKFKENNIGNGSSIIDIKGGIGRININFDYKEESLITEEDESSIKILEYFMNKDDEWIIVGELETGFFEDGIEVKLMQDDEEKGVGVLQDETNRYSNYSIDRSMVKDKVFIKIDNINEAQLKLINYIRK